MIRLGWNEYECYLMALTVWREARGESFAAKLGVIFTVLNRVKAHSWFGDSISEVLLKPMQYTSITCPGDRQLIRFPVRGNPAMGECMNAVQDVINQQAEDPTGGATHYYDISLDEPGNLPPAWATPETFKLQIGRLKFYRAA